MFTITRRRLAATAGTLIAALALTACTGCGTPASTETDAAGAPAAITVTDNRGEQPVPANPTSIVATDNRTFQTLHDWGIELKAAPVNLISTAVGYRTDESIVNLGNHREPDLEALVAVQPDLIINGQRFAQYYDDIRTLVPEATIIDLDPREGEPFDAELIRQTQVLGEVFGKQDEAQALVDDFTAAIQRVKDAYNGTDRVMAVITSGGEINYAAPGTGRTLGPVFAMLGLVPALETEGSTDHQGDDISVEAIADANPDWILVMDRDAAVSAPGDTEYRPAQELLAESAALQNVTAVQHSHLVYMPQDTYVNEGIQTYTAFFNTLADAMEAAK